MNNQSTMMSSESVEWTTPKELYDAFCKETTFKGYCDIDLACTEENQLCDKGMYATDEVLAAYALPTDTKEQRLERRHVIIDAQKKNAKARLNVIRHCVKPSTWFLNCPYGYELPIFMKLAWDIAHMTDSDGRNMGHTVVCLVPARTDTDWWWRFCVPSRVIFLKGRVRFGGCKAGAPFPSAVVIMSMSAQGYLWMQMKGGKLLDKCTGMDAVEREAQGE